MIRVTASPVNAGIPMFAGQEAPPTMPFRAVKATWFLNSVGRWPGFSIPPNLTSLFVPLLVRE